MIAMMGGTHSLVSVARQKSGEASSPDGGAVFLEPSFASAARHGTGTSTLPPLGRHLVAPAILAQYLPPTSQVSKGPEGEGLVGERSGGVARRSAGFDGDDDLLKDESLEDESRQAILPPNITSIYAPFEVIGAIVQEERDKAQEEFQKRLKEAAEDSMRKVEVAYMPVASSNAATMEPSESRQTAAESDDTAALLHVSPAFFAAYGTGTGTGDGDGAVPPRPRAAAGETSNGNKSGVPRGISHILSAAQQPENVAGPGDDGDEAYSEVFGRGSEGGSRAYSRSASGSGLGPLPAMAQSHSRRESGSSRYTSSAHSAAAVAVPSGGVGPKKRDSVASRATSSEIALLEPVVDVASDMVPSRRESAVSRGTGGSGTPRPTDDALSDAALSRQQSRDRQSSATRGNMAAATSGGHISRQESAADRAGDSEGDVVSSAGPSRRESELSNAVDAAPPSRRESAASRHEPDAVRRLEGNASTSRRESSVSNGAISGDISGRRGSAASVGVRRGKSGRSSVVTDPVPSRRESSVSAAAAGAGPSRRDSSVSNLASEGQVPLAAARVDSDAGTNRRGPSTKTSSPVRTDSATAPSKRDSAGSLSVSGSEAPATAAANTSRQESNISSYSVPPSSEDMEGAPSARGLASGKQQAIDKPVRGSDSVVGMEHSLGLLPLTPVAVQPEYAESKVALKAKDDEEESDVEEEESEGDSDLEAAPQRKDEGSSEEEEEEEEEEEDGQRSGTVEARKKSMELDSDEEGNDVRSSDDGSHTEDETEEEEEDEEEEEAEEEEAEEEEEEEAEEEEAEGENGRRK
ncbi:hypothetical protein Vafri_12770 [Volvox africanus]|nr:hypothetical protein Vafri_12770 [Volvox africanus]